MEDANLPTLFPIPTLLSIFAMVVEARSDGLIKDPRSNLCQDFHHSNIRRAEGLATSVH